MTETEQAHHYTYPHTDQEKDCPVGTYSLGEDGHTYRRTEDGWVLADPEPREEPRHHRAMRPTESGTELVLRAIGWAILWFIWGFSVGTFFAQGFPGPLMVGASVGSVALLLVVGGHRRRQR